MLQRNRVLPEAAPTGAILSPAELVFKMLGIVRRHIPIMILSMALFLGLAIAYLAVTPAKYLAYATMIMDTHKAEGLISSASNSAVETPLDNPTVESQVEVLKSGNIAQAVIRNLKLDQDPTFIEPSGLSSLVGKLRSMVGGGAPEPVDEDRRMQQVVAAFQSGLNIRRIGVTFVFEISYLSTSPERAAQIANAVAEAYVDDQLEAKYQSTRRAASWLQDRLQELGNQASDAERAVVDFKVRNNIVDTGGRLLSEQQLSELNSQLTLARASMGEAQARMNRIDAVIKSDVPDWSVTDALTNEVIIKLRAQYSDLAKRAADLSVRLGPKHQAVINVRNDMAELKRSINEELQRIGEGYRSDYEISKARVESLESSLQDAVSASQTSDQAQVQLRGLESAAQSYRALYDSFLQRYMESVQAQSFPLTEARLVTKATPPTRKSQPRFSLTLGGSLVLGALAGFGLAWLREMTDKTLRTPSSIENLLGVECIASVPDVGSFRRTKGSGDASAFREVVAKPISRFSEAVRGVKVAVDFFPETRQPQIVGMISSLPGEGKTTLAANLAELAAHSGGRAILIDGDLRNPSLTARLAPGTALGLKDVLAGAPLENVIVRTKDGKLDFIPAVKKGLGSDSNEIISSQAMHNLLQTLKGQYDYVIVDMPPLLPIIDSRAAADLIDVFVFVVEWGETSAENVQRAFQLSSRIQQKTAGVVLNKVDQRIAKHFFSYEYGSGRSPYYSQ